MVVLVVDDSGPVRARLAECLREDSDIDVREAGGASDAAATLSGTAVDAVILDLHLSEGSGLDLLERVKARDRRIVVVVLTNDASEQHRRECLQRGADYFFDKSHQFARACEIVLALAPLVRDVASGRT